MVFEPGFTSAVQIGVFENGSPEWHQQRAMGIGGSEISTICGLNKWESAFTLWCKKTGRIQDNLRQSEPMYWGSRLESVIVDEFARRNPGVELWREAGTWHHPNAIWQLANPDALFHDEQGYGIIEVKTAAYADDWILPAEGVRGTSDGVPRYYLTQVQWYLRIFGFKRAIVVALFSGNKYREFEVLADDFQQSADLGMAENFWQLIQDDERPTWDGSDSTYESVRALHPEIDDSEIEIDPNIASAYKNALSAFETTEGLVKMLKSEILDSMGHAKVGLVEGRAFVKRQAGRNGAAPFLVNVKEK